VGLGQDLVDDRVEGRPVGFDVIAHAVSSRERRSSQDNTPVGEGKAPDLTDLGFHRGMKP
jgi:hypothetical protein